MAGLTAIFAEVSQWKQISMQQALVLQSKGNLTELLRAGLFAEKEDNIVVGGERKGEGGAPEVRLLQFLQDMGCNQINGHQILLTASNQNITKEDFSVSLPHHCLPKLRLELSPSLRPNLQVPRGILSACVEESTVSRG